MPLLDNVMVELVSSTHHTNQLTLILVLTSQPILHKGGLYVINEYTPYVPTDPHMIYSLPLADPIEIW